MVRAAAVLAALAAVGIYDAFADRLPNVSVWSDVALLGLIVLPASLAAAWLALPFRRPAGQTGLAVALIVLAVAATLLELAGLDVAANLAKLAAVVVAGWWFLVFFETVSWVLAVALLIVPVDIFSVARGPTKQIVEKQPDVFNVLSIAFPIPGEHTSAQLGLPDVLFFALFLGAADRFGLRMKATWFAMVVSFGATLAAAVWWDVSGLPALPLLSVAFVGANADLLWRRLRSRAT